MSINVSGFKERKKHYHLPKQGANRGSLFPYASKTELYLYIFALINSCTLENSS